MADGGYIDQARFDAMITASNLGQNVEHIVLTYDSAISAHCLVMADLRAPMLE